MNNNERDFSRFASGSGERNARIFILFALTVILFVVFAIKLFSLQVVNGSEYRQTSQTISSHTNTIAAQRGEIFDRNATLPLVINTDSFAVLLKPGEIPNGLYDSVAAKLAKYLGISKKDIDERIGKNKRSFNAIEIRGNVPFNTISNIAENLSDLPGVSWQSKPIRNYVEAGSMSHIIGYVGNITDVELKSMYNDGYRGTNIVGKMGIERQYDKLLKGTPGRESRTVDARGRVLSDTTIFEPPEMGNNLVLTIDSRIQALTEKALGSRVGAAVVLRPSNGEILAMVSYPYYDPNFFNTDYSAEDYKRLQDDPNKPLLNRVVNATYPPASTFKTIMTTAILTEKALSSDKKIECPGHIRYGDRVFNCHIRGRGHGWLDLKNALAQSCDIYYWVAGRDNLGVEKIANYTKAFGFDKSLEIDLPSHALGFVPTPQWKERRFHEKWLGGDTMNMSIGQGFTLATPLHVANMIAMVSNEGVVYKPHLLKEVRDPATNNVVKAIERTELLRMDDVPESVWKEVQADLRYVITDGTAQYPMNNKKVQIAGKTGTAEVAGYKDSWHSWMAAYAPYDGPKEEQVVVVVLVEACNDWEWWAPYCTNIIIQGIFADQTFDEAVDTLGFRYILNQHIRRGRQE